jgi:Cu(I)/Ag(I) efflux system membrane fusion protein
MNRRLGWIAAWIALVAIAVVGACDGREPSPVAAPLYRCAMHPGITSDRPGECPICLMSLVPIGARHEPPVGGGPPVAGLAPVQISPAKRQLIGVKTAKVERLPFVRTVHAVGRVTLDETRLHHMHTKVAGYVERIHAHASGQPVRRGEPLLDLYSPELLATQEEYLVALEGYRRSADSRVESVASASAALVASARRRLELFDVTEEQILRLEATGEAQSSVTLEAPMSGTIIARNVTHGEKVDPEMTLLDIADLSTVWVLAAVYEYELPFVHAGQAATMRLAYLPGRSFVGRVSLVYPTLDPATRTVQVRLEFQNTDLVLKPEMFTEVELEADLGEQLSVPDTAVMDTGTRSVAFVDRGEGVFEPREVTIGLRLPDRFAVLSGLEEGEVVLSSANFYVDSESRLKAALDAMTAPPAGVSEPAPPAHRH